MGNTMGIDMGDTIHFLSRAFYGHIVHVVERTFLCGAAASICEVGIEGPTKHVAVMSVVRVQSQAGLQMEGPVRAGGKARSARSNAATTWIAPANGVGVADSDSAIAPTPSELGQSEAWSSVAQRISASSCSLCADDRQMVAANEIESPRPTAFASGAATQAPRVDDRSAQQPGLDGGFQGLVSNARRSARGAVDGAGYVQSLSAERPFDEGSKLAAGSSGFPATVPAERIPHRHPDGQRSAVRIGRSGRAFALECLVDRFGDSRGVHSARASRAEWRARTNASGAQGRDDATCLLRPAGSTTADPSLGKRLQRDPSPRGFGAAVACRGLSFQARASSPCSVEIPQPLDGASGSEQRPNQMAGTQAVCRRGIRWVSGRSQTGEHGKKRRLFCWSVDRRNVGSRSGRDAASQICAPGAEGLSLARAQVKSRPEQNPRASRWGSHRSDSLRSPERSEPQRDANQHNPQKLRSRICYPCECSKCYPCVCPLPTPALSPRRGRSTARPSNIARTYDSPTDWR